MPIEHSPLAGASDYSTATTAELSEELLDFAGSLDGYRAKLADCLSQVSANAGRLDGPRDIEYFIKGSDSFLAGLKFELVRIGGEIRAGILSSHVVAVRQMLDNAQAHERRCVRFDHEHIEIALKDESLRDLVDEIYRAARQPLVNLWDLSGVGARMEALVVPTPKKKLSGFDWFMVVVGVCTLVGVGYAAATFHFPPSPSPPGSGLIDTGEKAGDAGMDSGMSGMGPGPDDAVDTTLTTSAADDASSGQEVVPAGVDVGTRVGSTPTTE